MAELYPGFHQGTKHCNDFGAAPITVLTGIEAIQKRPYMYVGYPKDNNGLNVVREAISYATNVVSRGGEAFIRYGDGSRNSPFIVRTFEETELDLENMFALHCGKLENDENYRFAQLGVTLALCKEFQIIHFNEELVRSYNFSSGKKTPNNCEQPNDTGHLPGIQLRMTLDLNVVERVPYQAFIEHLAKNPWFHWTIEMPEGADANEVPIFRGLPK
jgi:hypothetical protein